MCCGGGDLIGLAENNLDSDFLGKIIAAPGVAELIIDAIDSYVANQRRDVPLTWARIGDGRDAETATQTVILSAQKGVLD